LDLTRGELEERFLRPYRQGRPIVIGGRTIPMDDLAKLRISETAESSDALLPVIQARRRASGVITTIPDDWYIANYGRDFTDELITAPPGSDMPERPVQLAEDQAPATGPDPRSIFVVHGRNMAARDAMFTFLRALHLEPIEWNEAIRATGRPSPFIGEVLNAAFSRAQTVLVLMTPDDEARLREEYRQEATLRMRRPSPRRLALTCSLKLEWPWPGTRTAPFLLSLVTVVHSQTSVVDTSCD
jgi:hypothetical protein